MTDPTAAREKAREFFEANNFPHTTYMIERLAALLTAEQRGREAAVPAGWRLVPDKATAEWAQNLQHTPTGAFIEQKHRAAVIYDVLAAAPHKGADDE